MKNTGIIRYIDDLGRVVIPKEIRKNSGIKEGDPLEIWIEGENVIFKRHLPEDVQKEEIAKQWMEANNLYSCQSRYRIEFPTIYCEAIVRGFRTEGKAELAKGDKFSSLVGMVIAHCRATGKTIPSELLE